MALFLFTKAILEGRPIDVFNQGQMRRDFTYIDDIVESIVRVLDRPAAPEPSYRPEQPDPATSNAPYRLFNVGSHEPIPLLEFIGHIESELGAKAEKRMLPLQSGDVPATYADVSALRDWTDTSPATPIKEGIARFVRWYRGYYKV
jgi:UDP-glucuronate 4-epimerase